MKTAPTLDLRFLGATGTVTGSKYLLTSGRHCVLVDCGLFQGYKQLRLRNWAELPLNVRTLDAVVLTHAHIDHSGYLPLLVKNGFKGPIYCTEGTYDLCRILLPDAGRLQEEEAENANRGGWSKHRPAQPLYTEKDALRALENFETRPFEQDFNAAPGLGICLKPAGHILGSAMVSVSDGRTSILFSGDLGRPNDPIMHPPVAVKRADYLVLESTYGNRRHEPVDPVEQLGVVIRRTIERGGVVIIPSFAVGRTQSLLYGLYQLKQRGAIPDSLPVFLNSPMAQDVTAIYRRHQGEHRLSEEECQGMCQIAHRVTTVEESKRLNQATKPMVIIAGSGMATGGRVTHHLKQFAPDARNTILFAGFQAGGTRGAALLNGAETIKIHGQYVAVRAEIARLDNLSAHADYAEILAWLKHFERPPRCTYLTHGEPDAADALRVRIEETLGWSCRVPDYMESASLSAAG